MSRILVTGATGFVGRALVPVLERAGHTIVAAVRAPSDAPWLANADQRAIGDIGPDTDWSAALEGVQAVAHLAARVHMLGENPADSAAAHRRVNSHGTRRLAEAAAAAGVRRFLFLSTIKVNGERTLIRPFREDDPPAPSDPYAASKWEAENALREVAARTGMEAVILRPPLVYGPGVKGNFLNLVDLCRRGVPMPIGCVSNRRSLVAVGNLAGAARSCLDHPAAAGETFLVRDGDDVSTPELARRIARAFGRRIWLPPVPTPMLRLAGRATGKSAVLGRLLDSLAVDDGKLRKALGWTPSSSMDEALAETAAWFAPKPDSRRQPDR